MSLLDKVTSLVTGKRADPVGTIRVVDQSSPAEKRS